MKTTKKATPKKTGRAAAQAKTAVRNQIAAVEAALMQPVVSSEPMQQPVPPAPISALTARQQAAKKAWETMRANKLAGIAPHSKKPAEMLRAWTPPAEIDLSNIPMPKVGKQTNALENAVCIAVQKGILGNTRKLSLAGIEIQADKAMLRLSKMLIDSPEYEAIKSHDGRIGRYLSSVCLPSMLPHSKSVWFVPNDFVHQVEAQMLKYAEERTALVAAFKVAYPARVTEGIAKLQNAGSAADYIPVEKVADEFYFTWQYLEFGVPGSLKKIDSALFRQEKERNERQWAEATALAQQTLRACMAKLVDHMVDRLSGSEDGKPKRFNSSVLENVSAFLECVDGRNITNDTQLKALADRAKQIVKGIDPELLRNDSNAREYVAKGFATIRETLSTLMVNTPTRAIRFED